MIDFIPLEIYSSVVYFLVLFFILLTCIVTFRVPSSVIYDSNAQNAVIRFLGVACFVSLIVLLGLRPVSYAFGDMGNYAKQFSRFVVGVESIRGDLVFEGLMWVFARFFNAGWFFFVCTLIYLVPIVISARLFADRYWPLVFFFAVAQFDFYGYGVNGLRQGMAASIFILGVVVDKKWLKFIFSVLAVGLHKSFLVPVFFLMLINFFWDYRYYLVLWLLCLLSSLLVPSISEFFATSLFSRAEYSSYINPDQSFVEELREVGFRWDFVLYSAFPILVGGFFLYYRRVIDETYQKLYSLYLGVNAFWLLMIGTVVSNRIAYLSWCLIAFVVVHPFLHFRVFESQNRVFSVLLMVFYFFTLVSHL